MKVGLGSNSGATGIASQDAEEEEREGGRYISDSGPSVAVYSVCTSRAQNSDRDLALKYADVPCRYRHR